MAKHSSHGDTKPPVDWHDSLWEHRNAGGTIKQGVTLLPSDHEQRGHYGHGHTGMFIIIVSSLYG